MAAPPDYIAEKFLFGGLRGSQNLVAQTFRGSRFKSETWMEAFGPRFMPTFTPSIIEIFDAQLAKLAQQQTSNIQDLLHAVTIKVVWARMIGHMPDEETQFKPILKAMDTFTEDLTSLPLPFSGGKLAAAKAVLSDIALRTVKEKTAQCVLRALEADSRGTTGFSSPSTSPTTSGFTRLRPGSMRQPLSSSTASSGGCWSTARRTGRPRTMRIG